MMADDEYNKKLESLQQYIPFLENMIIQLKDPSKKNREQQLSKMESLHAMITDRKKKLKLETLNKCEDVITKLYLKVNHKPFSKNDDHVFQSTPSSPSPPLIKAKDFFKPVTIPTERLEPNSRIPKVDIYSSAAESLRNPNKPNNQFQGKLPDLSKPPISLDDLKCLEVDVHDKINERASLKELKEIRNKIATELIFENIKSLTTNSSNNTDNTPNEKDNWNPSPPKPKSSPKESPSILGEIISNINEKIEETRKTNETNKNEKSKWEEIHWDSNSIKIKSDDKKTPADISPKPSASTNIENKNKDIVILTDDEMALPLAKVASKIVPVDAKQPSPQYKRLADKYNPKPRKSTIDADVDKAVADSIEANMKFSPPKLPAISKPEPPPPPPASLVKCARQMDFELQNSHRPNITSPIQRPPILNSPLLLSPRDNFVSEYVREEYNVNARRPHFEPPQSLNNRFVPPIQNQRFNPQFNNFNHRDPPLLDFQPANNISTLQYNAGPPLLSPEVPHHFMEQKPHFGLNRDMYLPKDDLRWRIEDNRPSWDRWDYDSRYNRGPMTYREHRELRETTRDPRLARDNADPRFARDNADPRLARDNLDPRLARDNADPRLARDNMDPRLARDNADPRLARDPRDNADPRLVRDPRDNADSRLVRDPRDNADSRLVRDPRDNADSRLVRDPRDNADSRLVRDPRDNADSRLVKDNREHTPKDNKEQVVPRERVFPKDNREADNRDPRILKDKFKSPKDKESKERESKDIPEKLNRDPRLNRDAERDRSKSRNRYESKFDMIYSATNKESESKSKSRKEKESFVSPLDSLYSGKVEHRTGKGYGVQSFRIPKKKKEEKEPVAEIVEEPVAIQDEDNVSGNESPVLETEQDAPIEEPKETAPEITETINPDVEIKDDLDETPTTSESKTEVPTLSESKTETPASSESKTETEQVEEVSSEESKPVTEQTILAHFFSNLLSSQNKKDKKSALYSLISTFSDTFSSKELEKITKIINANDEAGSVSDEEVKSEKPVETETAKIEEIVELKEKKEVIDNTTESEDIEDEEKKDDSEAITESEEIQTFSKRKLRSRRISSTSPIKEKPTDSTSDLIPEKVVVTVGERIKSRKRNTGSTDKPKKKCKSELDKLHEDIQEMFIRDGILTASGKRMCNLLKGDPSVLTGETQEAEETVKIRKKPGPKSKTKLPNDMALRNIRILIHKIPDNPTGESSVARRLTRSMTNTDIDDASSDSTKENTEEERSESESEKETESPNPENEKTKTLKRKRVKSSWASGIIRKKKKKQSSTDDSIPPKSPESPESEDNDFNDFLAPDKNYYVDFASQKSYSCRLCEFKGRYITTHYKLLHPESEVMSSRFSPSIASQAIIDAKNNMDKYESCQMIKNGGKIHFICRFCDFNTVVVPTLFYDHLSTHTGEYRHICPNCSVSFCNGKSLKSHMLTTHPGEEKPIVRKSHNNVMLFGYLCGECNFVQINKNNLEEHVNIYHLEKPVVHKINLSTNFDEKIEAMHKVEQKSVESPAEPEPIASKQKKQTTKQNTDEVNTASPKKRKKPGPKSKKKLPKSTPELNTKSTPEVNTKSTSEDSGVKTKSTSEDSGVKTKSTSEVKTTVDKPKMAKADALLDTDKILPFRAKRAAKEKAQEKLKVIMEMNDSSPKKKALPEESKKTDESESPPETNQTVAEKEDPVPPIQEPPPEAEKVVKKEIDMNVFTCNTDIQKENEKIEQERLQKMDELNKEFGSRTSLNFTDKLCNRLNQNDVPVKEEPKDDFVDNMYLNVNKSPIPMPVLEKNPPTATQTATPIQIKKQFLESVDAPASTSFDVAQKNDKSIMNMIEKLKGKLNAVDGFKSNESEDDGPPPLTHVNELTNIKPPDASAKTLEICGLLKVIKTDESTTFSCLVPPCVFFTENKDQFQTHCKEHHASISGRISTLCETCGMEINATPDASLLENLFQHTIVQHADFIKKDDIKPRGRMLRIRKLSGDALSVQKDENEDDHLKNTENKSPDDGEQVEDNPFPFKISGVMSLAEPLPPLTPIVKQTVPILVKEAKLTSAEMAKPRKTQKAMTKFIEDVGNLYKCPHYYCLFTTNFRDFLERHLKAHNTEKDSMIPCVYCDLKTPWEHVAIHIDIRHGNCKYACSYCLYRACLKNYVFLHQDRAHSFLDYSVIALPSQKAHKKFAIADVKLDPTTLCEPYKCLPACNKEFLFENEFMQHLTDNHRGFLTCGHEDCSSRVMVSKMIHHWSVAHAISFYQCGYCKTNSNELTLMYHHLSQMHQNLNPEIYVRIITPQPDSPLGYTAEAFKHMRKIATLPNITEGEKGEIPITTQPLEPVKNLPSGAVTHFPHTIQVVTSSMSQNTPRTILIPGPKVIGSVSASPTASSSNLYLVSNSAIGGLKVNAAGHSSLLPGQNSLLKINATGQNSLLNTNGGQLTFSVGQQFITSPSQSTSENVSKVLTLTTQSLSSTITSEVPKSNVENTNLPETPIEPVEPLEHVTLQEEANQDELLDSSVDPLDLGETVTSQSTSYSSEDDSDSAKSKKKSGLLGYQLFRCAFCDNSCSNSTDFRKHASKSLHCKSRENLNKPFMCVHCRKAFRNSQILTEHIQCHGILRYSCSLCGNKFPTSAQARTHMKNRHSINQTTQTILNPEKISAGIEEYIIKPKLSIIETVPKESGAVEFSVPAAVTDNVFNPDEVEKIPMRSIFSSDLSESTKASTTEVQTITSRKKTNAQRCREYREKKKLQNTMVQNITSERPYECSETGQLQAKKPKTNAERRRKHYEAQKLKKQESKKIPKTVKQKNKEYYDRKKKCQALNHHSEACGICNYTTKVRTNMVRHLQFHSQEKAVSDSAPVNPVPCLEKNEKMFDKMINLASSSHKTRMGGGAKPENKDVEIIPEFVPSHTRYTCCAQGCNYICPEEGNLRHHLMALHGGETSFICVHCKAQLTPTDADSLIKHLRLHGLQLYKCQYCNMAHNLKHKIEKHCGDAHADMPNKVITIRHLESESTGSNDGSPGSSTPISAQSKSNKPWRCLMCKFRTVAEENIRSHVLEKHEIDSQYKCAYCAYKTNDKDTFPGHCSDHHPNQEIDIIPSYRKVEEENRDDKEGDSFDTTPLWQRDRPRIKHIRGILFDESAPAKSPKKPTKTPSGTTKSAARNLDLAIESVVTGTDSVLRDDNSIDQNKQNSDVIVIDDNDDDGDTNASNTKLPLKRKMVDESPQNNKMIKMEDAKDVCEEEDEKALIQLFGDFGNPLNKQLKCPVCNKFKSKRISDFIFHLFKEKRIYRYKCGICGDESITYRYMSKHVKEHKQDFNFSHIITMAKNPKLELWLQMLIRSQCTKIIPFLVHTPESTIGDKIKMLCRYCNKWYKSEQERNEHAITHWNFLPFKCAECPYSSFTQNTVEKHFTKFHPGLSPNVINMGPTVGAELQHADYMHMKEVEEEFFSEKSNETNIAEVLVPTTTVANMIDESEQDGTVFGMSDILETTLTVGKPLAAPEYEPVDDLVIVTKTDTNVPHSGDVFCCEYCPYMSNSEPIMLSHITSQHEHMHIKFRVLNQSVSELKTDDYVACVHCQEVGSEIQIRQHHMNIHDGETFLFYRYTCNSCQKRFVKLSGLKLHSQRVHPGVAVTYTGLFNNVIPVDQQKSTRDRSSKDKSKNSDDAPPNRNLLTVLTPTVRGWKRYQCTECSYQRDFPPQSFNNVRCHVKTHFKAYLCGACGLKFKTRSETITHHRKDHLDMEENIIHDKDMDESFQECMRTIHGEAMPIPDPNTVVQETVGKATARKSTSSYCSRPMEEFSYYGEPVEKDDLHKIMTSVEINGICLDMTADKLGKIFDLNPIVSLEKFDSAPPIIEIDS